MTSDFTEQADAAREKVLNCRESIARARKAREDDPENTAWVREYELRKTLEMIRAAQQLNELNLMRSTHRPTLEQLRECEVRLGLPAGVFAEAMRERRIAQDVTTGRFLEMAKDVTEAQLAAPEPTPVSHDVTAAIIRVCCATVVGAFVGAPLGALAIQENILKKMVEAAIVVGLGAIAAEIAVPLSELARRPAQEPAVEPTRLSAVDLVLDELLHPDDERGQLRRLPTEPVDEPVTDLDAGPARDLAKDPAEEPADKAVGEPLDKPAEDPVDEALDKPADEPLDKPAEDPVDEALDEPVDEPVEEPIDDPVKPYWDDPDPGWLGRL